MHLERSGSTRGRGSARSACAVASLLLLLGAGSAWAQTLERVREAGVLTLGYVAGAEPFSTRDASGNPAGYTVDLCRRIGDAVKEELRLPALRVEFVEVGIEERFAAVHGGKVDVLCAAGTATLSRREQVAFSIPVFPSGVGALMRKDAPERMRAILAGEPEPQRPRWRASLGEILKQRIFAVPAGTTAETWLVDKVLEFDIIARVEPVNTFEIGVDRVLARQADVLFGNRELLLSAAKRSPSAEDLMVLERYFTYEPIPLATARGDEDLRLLVDRTLSRLYRSGEIEGIYAAHFGAPGAEAKRFFRMTALPE